MATFVVTFARDVANGNTSAANLSLREAIGLANSHAGADRITFADDVHRVTLRDALPIVADDLRLVGGGDVLLDANASSEAPRRALDIRGDGIEAAIDGLTITGGSHARGGGGIRAGRDVDLRVVDCEIVGNNAGFYGYGAKGGGIWALGDLTLLRSQVAGNRAYGNGGGTAVFGEAIVRASTIEGNRASNYGGGIAFFGEAAVRGSTIAQNGAYLNGGGIFAADGLTITNSDVLGNRTDIQTHYIGASGGGICVTGDLTVGRSMVEGNAAGDGGGIAAFGTATILSSTIESNSADGFQGGFGGGVMATGDLHVWRSLVAGNGASPGYADSRGGGIAAQQDVTLFHAQILGNQVNGLYGSSSGGGISALGLVEASHSVVSGNRANGYAVHGGPASGGGISAGRVVIRDSSITENTVAGESDVQGGGVFARRIDAFNSTVAWNQAHDLDADTGGIVGGGALWVSRRGSLAAVTLSGNEVVGTGVGGAIVAPDGALGLNSSLVVGNAAADGDNEVSGTPVLLASVVGGDGRLVFAAAEQVAPGIFGGVLADNGGATPTILLNLDPANPAIGSGNPRLEGTRDQRGVMRDADPDAGAVEARPATIVAQRPSRPGADDDAVSRALAGAADWLVGDVGPAGGRQWGEHPSGLPAAGVSRSGDPWVGGFGWTGPDFSFL